jgi:hypothetical protein
MPLDMTAIIKAARDHDVLLEINAQPDQEVTLEGALRRRP